MYDINTWIAVHIFITENCNGEIPVRSNVREISIHLLWHRHRPQNAITNKKSWIMLISVCICMMLYTTYQSPIDSIVLLYNIDYITHNTMHWSVVGYQMRDQRKAKLFLFSLGPRPHVLRLLSVLGSILHFWLKSLNLGSDKKYLRNPGNIWKLNTSANDLPMKPLSKRSRTSCPHYCIGPVPGHFDHWILYSCLMKQTTGLVFLLLLFKQRHHLTSDNRFKEHDEHATLISPARQGLVPNTKSGILVVWSCLAHSMQLNISCYSHEVTSNGLPLSGQTQPHANAFYSKFYILITHFVDLDAWKMFKRFRFIAIVGQMSNLQFPQPLGCQMLHPPVEPKRGVWGHGMFRNATVKYIYIYSSTSQPRSSMKRNREKQGSWFNDKLPGKPLWLREVTLKSRPLSQLFGQICWGQARHISPLIRLCHFA